MRPLIAEISDTPESVARSAATFIANAARAAVASRGKFVLAISGGRTPWLMLRLLAAEELPWPAIYIVQVDERVAPTDNPDRNLTHVRDCLRGSEAAGRIYPMPVEAADLVEAASEYAATLEKIAGSPPELDLVHLGLGADGHTASLVPSDPVLHFIAPDVATTDVYQGRRRITLTYPIINRARQILWVVTGSEKAPVLRRMLDGDESIPAGRVRQERASVVADEAAAAELAVNVGRI